MTDVNIYTILVTDINIYAIYFIYVYPTGFENAIKIN